MTACTPNTLLPCTAPQQPPTAPVLPSAVKQGCISDDHPLCLGPLGVHGLFTANTAINQCDTVLALGCRFDERAATKSFELWQVPRTVVHVDIRPQVSSQTALTLLTLIS